MTKRNEYAQYWRLYMTSQNEEGIRGIAVERYIPYCREGIVYFKSYAFKGSQRMALDSAYSIIREYEANEPVLVYSRDRASDRQRKKFSNLDIQGSIGTRGFVKDLALDVLERGVESEETLISEEAIPQLLIELIATEAMKEVTKVATKTQTKTTNGDDL